MYIIHYSYYESIEYVWNGIKQIPDLRILPHRDRAPGFEIPGSAPEYGWFSRFLIS